MSAQGSESDFEYEYDENETETFLVDLDLSSLNGVIKSRIPGSRKTLRKPDSRSGFPRPAPAAAATLQNQDGQDPAGLDEENEVNHREPTINPPQTEPALETMQPLVGTDIQILDLHTKNPIVSYQDQIYSCAWSDMIGTNLFFSPHEKKPAFEPQRSGDKFDVLGTSRIKLIGHKARITHKPGSKKRGRSINDSGENEAFIDEDELLASGKSLGNLRYNNAKVNADIKRQARFLEKFMDIKRLKGETDNVRTVVTRQSATAQNRARAINQAGQYKKAALHDEVERLNRRVVRGDTEALIRLQEIYSLLEEEGDEDLPEVPFPTARSSQNQSEI